MNLISMMFLMMELLSVRVILLTGPGLDRISSSIMVVSLVMVLWVWRKLEKYDLFFELSVIFTIPLTILSVIAFAGILTILGYQQTPDLIVLIAMGLVGIIVDTVASDEAYAWEIPIWKMVTFPYIASFFVQAIISSGIFIKEITEVSLYSQSANAWNIRTFFPLCLFSIITSLAIKNERSLEIMPGNVLSYLHQLFDSYVFIVPAILYSKITKLIKRFKNYLSKHQEDDDDSQPKLLSLEKIMYLLNKKTEINSKYGRFLHYEELSMHFQMCSFFTVRSEVEEFPDKDLWGPFLGYKPGSLIGSPDIDGSWRFYFVSEKSEEDFTEKLLKLIKERPLDNI